MKHKPRALGVSIFAGGFTVGVSRHFDVLAQFEESAYGVATVRKNFPKMPVHHPTSEWPLEDKQFNELDLIYGNPACAAWSVAGYTKTRGADKWKTDDRVQQTVRHFEMIERFRPKIWVTESVTQMYSKGQEFLRDLEAKAIAMGYNVYYLLHDTKWFGVPQSRKRVLVVCSRVDINWQAPNWAPPETALEALNKIEPTRLDWTVKIEPLVAKWLDNTYFEMPAGMRVRTYWENYVPKDKWQFHPKDNHVIGRPSFGHKRLATDRPSDVIVGYALIHPDQPRFITINEMQALCGFPPDYQFVANAPGAAASLIARGVCPPVGEWFARNAAEAVKTGKEVTKPQVFHVEFREPPGDNRPFAFELDPTRPVAAIPSARIEQEEEEPEDGTPREPKAKKPRVMQVPVPLKAGGPIAEPEPGQPRMAYLQRLIMEDRFTAEQMVRIVKSHWAESKVSEKDVSTQRRELKLMGEELPEVRKYPSEELKL